LVYVVVDVPKVSLRALGFQRTLSGQVHGQCQVINKNNGLQGEELAIDSKKSSEKFENVGK